MGSGKWRELDSLLISFSKRFCTIQILNRWSAGGVPTFNTPKTQENVQETLWPLMF